jgi:hypothetical protein
MEKNITIYGDWKLANVSYIYKGKGGSDNVANYRPISVTNCFIKILKKNYIQTSI